MHNNIPPDVTKYLSTEAENTILHFKSKSFSTIMQLRLQTEGVPHIVNGSSIACSSEKAMLIMLEYPDKIHRSDSNPVFVKDWITLVSTCKESIK